MTFKRKVTRKQFLKQPDEFITTTQRLVEFAQQNTRLVSFVLIGVVCLLFFGGLGLLYSNKKKGEARDLETKILHLYHRPVLTAEELTTGKSGFRSKEERYQVSLDQFQQLLDKYGWTRSGQRALLYIGDCYYGLKKFDNAKEIYEKYLAEYPDDKLMGYLVRRNLGYVSEAQGKLDEAISYYRQTLKQETDLGGLQLYLNIARCYELKQDWQQALNTYEEAVYAFSGNPDISEIKQHIQELENVISSGHSPQPSS